MHPPCVLLPRVFSLAWLVAETNGRGWLPPKHLQLSIFLCQSYYVFKVTTLGRMSIGRMSQESGYIFNSEDGKKCFSKHHFFFHYRSGLPLFFPFLTNQNQPEPTLTSTDNLFFHEERMYHNQGS